MSRECKPLRLFMRNIAFYSMICSVFWARHGNAILWTRPQEGNPSSDMHTSHPLAFAWIVQCKSLRSYRINL